MAVYFSRQLSKRSAVRQLGLTSGAVRQLESYDFPNNIQVLPLCQLAHCRSSHVGPGHLVDRKRSKRLSQSLCIPLEGDCTISRRCEEPSQPCCAAGGGKARLGLSTLQCRSWKALLAGPCAKLLSLLALPRSLRMSSGMLSRSVMLSCSSCNLFYLHDQDFPA